MKVSVSYLSSKDIANDLRKLDLCSNEFIHVDVMDGKCVPNKSLPFSEIKNIYKYTSKRLDVHLMVEAPSKYIPLYANLNCEYIAFHLETDEDIFSNIELIKKYGIKAGLVIKPNTKIKELVPYMPNIDMVLVMSVEPGMGGQDFIIETEAKLNELKDLIKQYDFDVVINVDGGITDKTIEFVKNSDIVTVGSYVINGENFEEKISSLR